MRTASVSLKTSFAPSPNKALYTDGKQGFERVGNRTRLLVDFFLHVVAIGAQFCFVGGQIRRVDAAFNFLAFTVHNVDAFAAELGDVALFEIHHTTGDREDRGNIGGYKVFMFIGVPHANEQWTTDTRADHHVRRTDGDDTNRVGTMQIPCCALRGHE